MFMFAEKFVHAQISWLASVYDKIMLSYISVAVTCSKFTPNLCDLHVCLTFFICWHFLMLYIITGQLLEEEH